MFTVDDPYEHFDDNENTPSEKNLDLFTEFDEPDPMYDGKEICSMYTKKKLSH